MYRPAGDDWSVGESSQTESPEIHVPDSKIPIAPAVDRTMEKRRSRRVQIAMPVIIRGERGSEPFEEKGLTAAVNAYGCMLRLSATLERGEQVTIINTVTLDEQLCTVTFLGQSDGAKAEVGLEFPTPCPQFWRMYFPPDDWDPADRKLPASSPTLAGRREV
jgi:hypothetical protein